MSMKSMSVRVLDNTDDIPVPFTTELEQLPTISLVTHSATIYPDGDSS